MEDLRDAILKVLNDSQLPLDAKYYVLKDVFRDVDKIYYDKLREVRESAESVHKA